MQMHILLALARDRNPFHKKLEILNPTYQGIFLHIIPLSINASNDAFHAGHL